MDRFRESPLKYKREPKLRIFVCFKSHGAIRHIFCALLFIYFAVKFHFLSYTSMQSVPVMYFSVILSNPNFSWNTIPLSSPEFLWSCNQLQKCHAPASISYYWTYRLTTFCEVGVGYRDIQSIMHLSHLCPLS